MADGLNGINTAALHQYVEQVKGDPGTGTVKFEVATQWKGGTKSVSKVAGYNLGGQQIDRAFEIPSDEPVELLGNNEAANPQELLMAAMNACMTVGIVATAASMGVTLKSLEIRTSGELDLRGFLGLDDSVKPGYDSIDYDVIIDGDFTDEQLEQIHDNLVKTSPNRWNVANAIRLNANINSKPAKADAGNQKVLADLY